MSIEETAKRVQTGWNILTKLNCLTDNQLKKLMLKLVGDNKECANIINTKCDITRSIKNSEVHDISFHWYDSVEISWNGITAHREHDRGGKLIYTFDEFTNVDMMIEYAIFDDTQM